MTSHNIDILLATYNGEKYISQQIYSLLAQTHKNWNLYVADDGSTDNTIDIIKSIMSNDDRLHIIDFKKPVKSAAKNFWRLLPYSKADFAIFCDQDDVWLDCKLELLLKKSEKWINKDLPNIVFCDAYIYSQKESKIVSDTLYPYLYLSFKDFIFHNGGYQGSSTLFNKVLKEKLLNYTPDFYIHDEIVALTAHAFGEVLFLYKPLMLYRIHENNIIGVRENTLLSKLNIILNNKSYIVLPESKNSKVSFYNFHRDNFSKSSDVVFSDYFKFIESNIFIRLWIILNSKMTKFRFYLLLKTSMVKVYPIDRLL
ncbi:glycosyltransferase family 2 protein [Psychrobacter glacincola]|uniref:Glycosyltransferase family 2 protein n=1 Tax=Psychrobacter glacincola TaxID=56810 RepID=A0ABW1W755_9GAMM|nr:glycosyltransferase family 2 protein [Psychrobacter glacincola]